MWILVDQSIVVTENVAQHLALGESRRRAALDGAREVALPVFVSTLTFIVVFFPVGFLSGIDELPVQAEGSIGSGVETVD